MDCFQPTNNPPDSTLSEGVSAGHQFNTKTPHSFVLRSLLQVKGFTTTPMNLYKVQNNLSSTRNARLGFTFQRVYDEVR